MSSGFWTLAEVGHPHDFVQVREVWGNYAPDDERTLEISDGDTSFFTTPERFRELIEQVNLTRQEMTERMGEVRPVGPVCAFCGSGDAPADAPKKSLAW